jgi:chemotaxis protein histidine kinase CheA
MSNKKSGQDGLLQWCANVTSGYSDVHVKDFTMSFKDGLAFCAIVHHHRPDLLDFAACNKNTPLQNHNKAFDAAEQCGVPRLLDAEDFVDLPKPDRLSVITYVSELYHCFKANAANAPPRSLAGAPAKRAHDALGTESSSSSSSSSSVSVPATDDHASKRRPASSQATQRPCAKCGSPLSGTVAEFDGVGFHVACFGCFACGKLLRSECIAVDGHPYCDQHGKEAFLASKRALAPTPVADVPVAAATPAKDAGMFASLRDKLKSSGGAAKPEPLPKKLSPTKPAAATATTAVAAAAQPETPPKVPRKATEDASMPAWKRKRLEEEEREQQRKASEEAAKSAKIAQLTGVAPVTKAAQQPTKAAAAVDTRPAASHAKTAAAVDAISHATDKQMQQQQQQEATAAAAAAERMHAEAAAAAEREREIHEQERALEERRAREAADAAEAAASAAAAAAAERERDVRAQAEEAAAAATGPPPVLPSKRATTVIGKCSQCNASVFARECVEFDGLIYHRTCYRCAVCARRGGGGPTDLKLLLRDKRLLCTSHLVESTKTVVASQQLLPPPDARPDWAGALQRANSGARTDDDAVFDGPPDGPPPVLPPKRRATSTQPALRPPTIVIKSFSASEYEEMTAAQQQQEIAALALQVPETLEGFLLKKGDIGFIKSWKRRLFVMREDCLVYYRDMEHRRSDILQGLIPLRGCTVCVTPQTVPGSFQINAPSRIWLLQATTADEAQRWIKNLRVAAARATMKSYIKGETVAPEIAAVAAPAVGDAKPKARRRERAAKKEGLVHVMHGVNNQWKAEWLVVRDGILTVHAQQGEKPYVKIPLYRCGLAEYDKNNPPPNLGFDFFGSLRRLVVSEQITDFRNTFQVCGLNRSIVIQTETIETMHGWLNAILEHKLFTESIIDSIEIDW